ncbi:alpha/beta fold hydrolase [Paenibacillus sp. GCM10012303]|uniref:alpha/beta fold hydrolase n=1 Tax=Paenibacillus sp. GCM10012303 TaxID=3317340 RepID=UPI00360E8472
MTRPLSIYKRESDSPKLLNAYDTVMKSWSCPYEVFTISTTYGACHVIASGPRNGEPLLFVHGMTVNSSIWYPTINELQAYRTYCIDVPGDFGKSTVTRRIRSPGDAIDWLDQVAAALTAGPMTLVGHSMGGWLCAGYALARPYKISRLLLLAPIATFQPAPILKLLRYVYPAMLMPAPRLIKRAWSWFCAPGNSLPPDVMEMVTAAYTYCRSQFAVFPGVYPDNAWAGFEAPVLLLIGDHEVICNPETVRRKAAGLLPHAHIRIIPQAGHCLTVEQATVVNREMINFLNTYKADT